ncbi:class II aldolase/adducin family protein [Streptomyces sp. NPDC052236]|uniref:class II aldolase/adducin family protein n=1 Tax=Streptomyces sp. NPDC052236 TaxID=3365686 RepID=UPI0037CD3A8B
MNHPDHTHARHTTVLESLVDLSRRLGDPAADLVILGEGNTSADLGDGSFLVKASGAGLAEAWGTDFVRLHREAVVELVDDHALDDHDIPGLTHRMRTAAADDGDRATTRAPSIEAMLHALALDCPDVSVVGHTHPTAVNALLCSDRAEELVAGPLFPDQVVVCGRHTLLVPYAEPGLPLGRAFRNGLRDHLEAHGRPPKVVYLANHGIVALGASAAEVLQITGMTVKAARILHAALSAGLPTRLPPDSADRLDRRPDEVHRRQVLAAVERAQSGRP